MPKSKIWSTLVKTAQETFQDNLVDIGVGGSFRYKQKVSDLDTVVVLRKMYLDEVEKFKKGVEQKLDIRTSCRPCTEMMFKNKKLLDGKTACMLYKGMQFLNLTSGKFQSGIISFEELHKIRKPLLAAELGELIGYRTAGKIDDKKALDLILQLFVIAED